MRSRTFLGALAVLASICLVPVSAMADTVDFTYTGVDSGLDFTDGATGTGSFTVDGSDNLTAFSLTINQICSADNCGAPLQSDTITWGLSDIQSFSATFSGDTLTALSLMTDTQPTFWTPYSFFQVTDLGAGDSSTGDSDIGPLTVGSLTIDANPVATPEPSSFVLLALGLSAALFVRQRGLAR
ncbi:MAG: PEP-CTERM sorting domain-containing protein [Terracidiphilus sp.]|jgi:hypothetical protein